MSFDLLAFPPSGPRTVSEVRRVLEADEQRWIVGPDDPLPPLGPEMALLVDEIRQRWPSLEDDPGSPWSVSPDWQPMMGGGTGLAIVWSRADEMYTAIVEIAARANVIIYDRQVPEVILPPGLTWTGSAGQATRVAVWVAVHHGAAPSGEDRLRTLVQAEPMRTSATRAANAVGFLCPDISRTVLR